MFILSCIPEIMASAISLISPLIPKPIVVVFLLISFVKLFILLKLDEDLTLKSFLVIIATSSLFNAGILMRFLSGYISNIAETVDLFVISLSGILIGITIYKAIHSKRLQRMKIERLFISFVIVYLISTVIIVILYYIFNSSNGDGSIKIAQLPSIQLPEIIKVTAVITSYISTFLISKSKKISYILMLYTVNITSIILLFFLFQERGTTLLMTYFTFISAFMILSKSESYHTYKPITKILFSSKAPVIMGSGYLFFIGTIKRVLHLLFPYRSDDGERIYGFNNSLFNLSSRLSADSSQIVSARQSIRDSWPIQLNFNARLNIPNASIKTALSDYAYVMLAQAFGKWVAVIFILFFVFVYIYVIKDNSDVLAQAAAVMIVSQIAVHISGIVFTFCYTGINIPFSLFQNYTPFLSPGGSSLLTSFIFFTFIFNSTLERNIKL